MCSRGSLESKQPLLATVRISWGASQHISIELIANRNTSTLHREAKMLIVLLCSLFQPNCSQINQTRDKNSQIGTTKNNTLRCTQEQWSP